MIHFFFLHTMYLPIELVVMILKLRTQLILHGKEYRRWCQTQKKSNLFWQTIHLHIIKFFYKTNHSDWPMPMAGRRFRERGMMLKIRRDKFGCIRYYRSVYYYPKNSRYINWTKSTLDMTQNKTQLDNYVLPTYIEENE